MTTRNSVVTTHWSFKTWELKFYLYLLLCREVRSAGHELARLVASAGCYERHAAWCDHCNVTARQHKDAVPQTPAGCLSHLINCAQILTNFSKYNKLSKACCLIAQPVKACQHYWVSLPTWRWSYPAPPKHWYMISDPRRDTIFTDRIISNLTRNKTLTFHRSMSLARSKSRWEEDNIKVCLTFRGPSIVIYCFNKSQ